MSHSKNNQPTKAEVQTTKLNKLPLVGKFEPEFSAEEAAKCSKTNPLPIMNPIMNDKKQMTFDLILKQIKPSKNGTVALTA